MSEFRTHSRHVFHLLGPLAPVVGFFLLGLLLLSASRAGLVLWQLERVLAAEDGWWVFPLGFRMDIVLLSILSLFPALALLLLPERGGRWWKPLFAAFFSLALATLTFMEASTVSFIAEYDTRPNRLFVEFLRYPREVFGLLMADYKLDLALGLGLTFGAGAFGWKLSRRWLAEHAHWGYGRRLLVLPLIFVLLVLGGRSSLGHRAANPSTVAFSGDAMVNVLPLSSTYSVAYAVLRMGDEADIASMYPAMPRDEVFARVHRYTQVPESAFSDPELPTLHRQPARLHPERPPNLVVVIEESLGAEYVGSLGGKPLTPNLDRLRSEGLLFTNLFATGTRTVRGMEAVIAGFPPTAGRSVVKLGLSQKNFFTAAGLLKQSGYTTEFIYGGESHFDNMAGFLLANGFDRVVDETDFDDSYFHGVWGVSDDQLMARAHQQFVSHGDRPFFALLLTTTNHAPFDFPPGKIELYEEPAGTVNNAIKYADYAIGELFRLAKGADYYDNTIFLIVADHNTRTGGSELVPVEKFHIPALLIGPGVPRGQVYDRLASQLDLMPTVLSLMGMDTEHPMPGRDLLALGEDDPGRAIMQFHDLHAFRVGEKVVIHQPGRDALQFNYANGRLAPVEQEAELVRDALAHIHLPAILYGERRYRLR